MAGADKALVKEALLDRAEDLFRQAWGEPAKSSARCWRAKASSARTMEMRGHKRGLWNDHKGSDGGDVLDFFAVEFCGLSAAVDDFTKVIEAAARWCGLSDETAPDLSEMLARKKTRDDAAQAAEAIEERRKAQLVNGGVKSGHWAAQKSATLGLGVTCARRGRPGSSALHIAGG